MVVRILRDWLFRPLEFRASMEDRSLWGRQVHLGLRGGWLFVLPLVWLGSLWVVGWWQLPVYYPTLFWEGIDADWGMNRMDNFKLLIAQSLFPFGLYLLAGIVVQFASAFAPSRFLQANPMLFWGIAFGGALFSCFEVNWVMMSGTWLVLLLFWGIYFSSYAIQEKDLFTKGDPLLAMVSIAAVMWVGLGIGLLVAHFREATVLMGFTRWFAYGFVTILVLPGFLAWAFGALGLLEKEESNKNGFFHYLCIFSTFLPLYLLLFLFTTASSHFYPFLFFLFGGLVLWSFFYFRIWSWVWVSLKLHFSRRPLHEVMLQDPALRMPPFCLNSRLLRAAKEQPQETLALGTYILDNVAWKKRGWKCIDLVKQHLDFIKQDADKKMDLAIWEKIDLLNSAANRKTN